MLLSLRSSAQPRFAIPIRLPVIVQLDRILSDRAASLEPLTLSRPTFLPRPRRDVRRALSRELHTRDPVADNRLLQEVREDARQAAVRSSGLCGELR